MAAPSLRRLGLTRRAGGFLLCGGLLLAVGLRMGWPPVAQLAIFLILIPIASLAVMGLRRDQLSARRLLATGLPQLGDPISVVLAVTPQGGGTSPIIVSDEAPPAMGGTHVAAIAGSARQHTSRHRYLLHAARRGRQELGPGRMYLTDRLGLVARTRVICPPTAITVVPRVHRLAEGIPTGATSGPGWGSTGAPGGSHDDVIPREYQPGDEMRRMDWRATARTGNLMVRGEEQPWRACLLVVLDRRELSHGGPPGADSFEAALSLVASVGCMALAQGWDLRLVDLCANELFDSAPQLPPEVNTDRFLRCLAELHPLAQQQLDPSLRGELPESGPTLLVLGENAPGTVQKVIDLLGSAHPAMATLVAPQTWDRGPGSPGRDPGPNCAANAELLRSEGWLVSTLTAGTSVPDAWAELQDAAAARAGVSAGVGSL